MPDAEIAKHSLVRVATNSMRVRFEILLKGDHPTRLRSAGEQALMVIHEVEGDLSPYQPESDIFRLNATPPGIPVRVQSSTVRFLEASQTICRATGGAFDPTVGPLLNLWGLKGTGSSAQPPSEEEIHRVRQCVGMGRMLTVDTQNQEVVWNYPGGNFDPGAAGKGWAIDRACDLLNELGVPIALVHGGTSSVRVLGEPFRIAVADGPRESVELNGRALGVSGVHGKSVIVNDVSYGHVIHPRSGWPVNHAQGAAVIAADAMLADAWSTALLVDPSLAGVAPHPDDAWVW